MTTSAGAAADARGVSRAIRTPRSAALAGVVFSVLFAASFIPLRAAIPADPADAGDWLADGGKRDVVLAALALVPFALAPRWLVASGYLIAILLLVAAGFVPWVELAFPAWVLALSLHVLVVGRRGRPA